MTTCTKEYEEFRRIAMPLAWLNATRPDSLRPLCGPLLFDCGYTLGPPGVQPAVSGVPDDRDRRRGRRRTDHDQQVDPAALDGDSAVASLTRRLAVHQP